MNNMQNLPTQSQLDLYRYFAAAAGANDVVGRTHGGGGGGGMFGIMPPMGGNNCNYTTSSSCCSGTTSFYTPGMMGTTAEATESAKATAEASRNYHKEAEKRRRERINSHLDRLRSLLPCTSKTDKATLLSKVVQRVLELKRQTSDLPDLENLLIPSENDDFAVYIPDNSNSNNNDNNNNQSFCEEVDGDDDDEEKIVLKASLCCEDRPDLFSDLSQVLSSLNMKALRAEISTLGGRVQSVLIVGGVGDREERAVFLRDALKGVVQRSGSGCEDRLKRRRRLVDPHC